MDKKYVISIEGQNLDMPAEIAADDEKLKSALAPFFPGAVNARIMRTEKDDVVTVQVIKQAGTKGLLPGWLAALDGLEEKRNPVIVLAEELEKDDPRGLSIEKALALETTICQAVEEGEKQCGMIKRARERLARAQAAPAAAVPAGF